MCRGDRPVAPTGAGDGDQPDCADRERRLLSAIAGSADFSRQRMHPKGSAPSGLGALTLVGTKCTLKCALPALKERRLESAKNAS